MLVRLRADATVHQDIALKGPTSHCFALLNLILVPGFLHVGKLRAIDRFPVLFGILIFLSHDSSGDPLETQKDR